jgi:peptide/nickel transport system permease protein
VTQFLLRRTVLLIPVLFGILFVTFWMTRLIPGDPCRVMLGERATEAACSAFRERFGLDQPVHIQFVRYLERLASGDLGTSIQRHRPVGDLLLERLPFTLELSIGAMLFAGFFGLILGVVSAVRHNSLTDVVTMIGANAGISMPVYWLGLMAIALFSVALKGTPLWMPPSGRLPSGVSIPPLAETFDLAWEGPAGVVLTFVSNMYTVNALISGRLDLLRAALWHLLMPSVVLGTIPLAIIARMTRSSLLEVLGLDYIRTSRAKGLKERSVIIRHGMRNALLPVVTVIGLSLGAFLSGAILTETIFNLTGMGKTLFEAIEGRDYIVIQGVTIVVAVAYLLVNLVVDVSYAFLDPRIRLS